MTNNYDINTYRRIRNALRYLGISLLIALKNIYANSLLSDNKQRSILSASFAL